MKSGTVISFGNDFRQRGFLCLIFLCLNIPSFAQSNLKDIGNAIKKGDAKGLSCFFDKKIDLTFSEKSTTYSKEQAEQILNKFFIKVEPSQFVNEQRGNSTANNTKFAIGNMHSGHGTYKVYMFFVQKNGHYVLRELRFEK